MEEDIVEPVHVESDVEDSVVEDDLESVEEEIIEPEPVEVDVVGSDVEDSVVEDDLESVEDEIVEPEPIEKEVKPQNKVNFNKSTDTIELDDDSNVNEKEDIVLDLQDNIEDSYEVKSDNEFNNDISEDKVDLDVDDVSSDYDSADFRRGPHW